MATWQVSDRKRVGRGIEVPDREDLVMNRGSNRKWGVCVGVLLPFEITTKSLINNTNYCKHKMTVAPPTFTCFL